MEVDPLLHVFFFWPCWEDTVKKVQGEDQCKNHHIILAITTLVPQNSLISDSNSEDQITEIQPTANRQSIYSSSSEQAVKIIGYKATLKLLSKYQMHQYVQVLGLNIAYVLMPYEKIR